MGEERGQRLKETTEQNERTLSNDEEEKETDDNVARIIVSKLQ